MSSPASGARRRILAIVNAACGGGRGESRWEQARRALAEQGVEVQHIFTQEPGHGREAAREAAPTHDILVAAGGDGTVGEVADGLIQSNVTTCALAVMPMGTGNDFAQLLGLGDISGGVNCLACPAERRMDVIEVQCQDAGRPVVRHALLFASVGIAGELLRRTTPRVKRIFGPKACYSVGLLRAIPGFRAPMMCLDWDGRRVEGRFLLACISNSERAGGGVMRLGPGAATDDGMLETTLIEDLGWLQILRCFPRLIKGTHVTHPKVRFGPARRLAVTTEPPMDVQMDGEVFGRTPVTFSVRPLGLRVLAASR